MGIDYKNRMFTHDNHEMLPAQTEALVRDIEHGEIAYIDIMDQWVDSQRKAWVDGNASLYTLGEVSTLGGSQDFCRIIGTHDGLVLDLSHFDARNWIDGPKVQRQPFHIQTDEDTSGEVVFPMPAVHVVTNYDELELAEDVLAKGYNIVLGGTELEQVEHDAVIAGPDEDDDEEDGDEPFEV